MNDNTPRPGGRPRRSPPWRAGALAVALAGVALLAAACGNGGSSADSSAAGGSKAYQQALAFARCMRSHGEPGWPDPTSNGAFSTSGIDLNSPQFSLASSACKDLRPTGGVHFQLSAAQQRALLKQGLKFAACMRAHGIPSFPDPDVQNVKAGGISFSTTGLAPPGQKPNWPRFLAASRACEPLMGGGGS
jgi:hypothetical protein